MIEKYFKYLILIRLAKDFDEVNALATFRAIARPICAQQKIFHFLPACIQAAFRCNQCNRFITF